MKLLPWSLTLKVIACTFHGVAIACTIFRLVYRWYMACFWWDDGWAAFAFAVDVVCLASALLEAPETARGITPPVDMVAYWMVAMGFPSVLWACRMSVLFSIVRVANPSQRLRRVVICVGCSFLIMWIALMGQKIHICLKDGCVIASTVALSQLITDVISDTSLVVLPIYLLRKTKIDYRQRIMIFSAFSASLLITAVTILHSIVLFTVQSDGIVVIGHVKTALSLIVCNLLVIVAFVYRVCYRGSHPDTRGEAILFTSVDLNTGLPESTMDKCQCTTAVTEQQHELAMLSEISRSMTNGTVEDEETGRAGVESKPASQT